MSGQAGIADTDTQVRVPTEDSSADKSHATTDTSENEFSPGVIRRRLIAADSAAVMGGVTLAFLVQTLIKPVPSYIMIEHLVLAACSLPMFAVGAAVNHLYKARANERPSEEVKNIVRATAVGLAGVLAIAFAVQYKELSRLWVLALGGGVAGLWIAERARARRVFSQLRSSGRMRRRILIVGTDAHAIGLLHTYERNPRLGYEVAGFVGPDRHAARGSVPVLGDIDDMSELLEESGAVGVVISLASVTSEEVNHLARKLTDERYHVALSSSLEDIDVTRLRPQQLDGRTMIYIEPTIHGGWRSLAKRVFDVVGASLILVVTLPVMAVAAIGVKITSPGPVLFRQTRTGKDGEPFEILKFRTMVVDAENRKADLADANEADGPLFKMENDPRVTGIGRVLRKLSIDELPQLACVLRGSMSMVGPRPALPDEVEQWDPDVRERLRVLPGLTGMWQVSGRSDSSFEHYKRMDLYYVHNWSLSHDLRICTKTVKVVLSGRGAS